METLTYAEFNEWLKCFHHSLTEILERWGDRLLIGDDGIGLLEESEHEQQSRHNSSIRHKEKQMEDCSKWLRIQIDTGTILDENGYPSNVNFCSAIFYRVEWVEELDGLFYMPIASECLSLN